MPDRIDWERLCETPVVKVGHRIAAMLLVPIMLGVGYSFLEMRDTVKALPDKLEALESRQDRMDDRLRFIERGEWR